MPVKGRSLQDTRGSLGGKVGRPRAAVPDDAAQRIEALAADGFSLDGVARKLGTNRNTLAQWFDADTALKDAFDAGREHERHTLHNVLYRLAVEKDDKIAAMFLLKARHSYIEGDRFESGNRVTINFTLPGAMKPIDYVVERSNDRSTENLPVSKARVGRS